MVPMHVSQAAVRTHAGKIMKVNEDTALESSDPPLYAVADGAGGTYASTLAVDLLRRRRGRLGELRAAVSATERTPESRLSVARFFDQCFNEASRSIHQSKEAFGSKQVASTLVAAFLVDRFAYVAHVGNSRAYLYREGALNCLTLDHTLAMDQLRRGEIDDDAYSKSPYRKALTQALGLTPTVEVDVAEVQLQDGDRLLLCTDGLTHVVAESTITQLLGLDDADTAADKLIQRALLTGAPDNVSVAVLHIAAAEEADDAPDNVAELPRIFLFKSLTGPERFYVAPYLAEHIFEEGTVICRENDIGNACFFIESGGVEVTRGGTPLTRLGPGTHFGELALARKGRRTATVRAVAKTRCFILTRDRFHELVNRRPELGVRMLLALLEFVGERLDDLSGRLGEVDREARGRKP